MVQTADEVLLMENEDKLHPYRVYLTEAELFNTSMPWAVRADSKPRPA